MPAVAHHLVLELAARPSGIAQRNQPARRAAAFADRAQNVVRARYRPAPRDLDGALAAPVLAVQNETARLSHRAAEEPRLVERVAIVRDLELVEHRTHRHARDRVRYADTHRALFVMADHRDHHMLEAGVADAGQREEQLAGEPGGSRFHDRTMPA